MLKSVNFKKIFYILCIVNPFFSFATNPEIVFPKDNYTTKNPIVTIDWDKVSSTNTYQFQISDNSSFTTTLVNSFTATNSYTFTFPQPNKDYYIRVKSVSTNWSAIKTVRFIDIGNTSNKLWLSAENTTTLGGFVTSWTDILHSNIATQTSTANQPQRNLIPLLNNLPVISFDGNTSNPDYLSLSNVVSANNYDLFVVRDYVNNTNIVQYFLGGSANGFFFRN